MKIKLEEFLLDEDFWRSYKTSDEIPTGFFEKDNYKYEYSPYNFLVGKERDKKILREVVDKFVNQVVWLDMEWDNLEKEGKSKNSPSRDGINDILVKKLERPPIIVSTGRYGSGKTLEQKILREHLQIELEKRGIFGYDFLAEPDKFSSEKFVIKRYPHPYGIKKYENLQKRAQLIDKIKRYTLYSAIGSAFSFMAYQTLAFIGLYQHFVLDIFFNIGLNLWYDLPRYLQMAEVLLLSGIFGTLHFYKKRSESKLPHFLATTRFGMEPLIGGEKREDIIGYYDKKLNDRPPQNRFSIEPKILKTFCNVFPIENLHRLEEGTQELLAQLIEEKIFPVASLGEEYNELFYCIVYATINPEATKNVIEALQAKFKYAIELDVTNEVDNTEINRRHLITLIRYMYKNLRFKREALEKIVEFCQLLAENKDKLYISRRIISLPERSNIIKELSGKSEYINDNHVKDAAREMLSFVQIPMKRLIEDLYKSYNVDLNGSKVGSCNIVCKILDPELKEEAKEVYLQSEDYLSYITSIEAHAKKSKGGKINIVSKGLSDEEINFYKDALYFLFKKDGINLEEYEINLSVPVLIDDKNILAGMYVAVNSAINGYKIDQSKVLAVNMNERGDIASLDRLNLRIFYSSNFLKSKTAVVGDKDYETVVAKNWFKEEGIKLVPVNNRKKLMEEMIYV
jgi:hypothetical protein